MRISRRLNLIVPIERDDGSTMYVHSTPVTREVFEQFFIVISKTFSDMHELGIGSRMAALMLRKVARDLKVVEDVENGLMAEIRRMSNAVVPTAGGWETMPLDDALSRKLLDGEDAKEVESAITFFTLTSSVMTRREMEVINEKDGHLAGFKLESLNSTEFQRSLPTSMQAANSGVTVKPLSVPS